MLEGKYVIEPDGDMWFAHNDVYFINIHENHSGFGETPQKALEELLEREKEKGEE